jgi:hypothetical protein
MWLREHLRISSTWPVREWNKPLARWFELLL